MASLATTRQVDTSKAIGWACYWALTAACLASSSKNGAQHGPGFAAESATGPVVAAVQMYFPNQKVRLLSNAQQQVQAVVIGPPIALGAGRSLLELRWGACCVWPCAFPKAWQLLFRLRRIALSEEAEFACCVFQKQILAASK
jgi:hypothetical protein